MKHGFKTKAEKLACGYRTALGLAPFARLPCRQLAAHLKIPIFRWEDIPGMGADITAPLIRDSRLWSALTFFAGQRPCIIHNTQHTPPRQESDIMHELAHIICNHSPTKVLDASGLCFRQYNGLDEEEASWLGAALQIPRRGLMWALYRRMTVSAIAAHFGASEEQVRYRQNMTGALTQLARSGFATRSPLGI